MACNGDTFTFSQVLFILPNVFTYHINLLTLWQAKAIKPMLRIAIKCGWYWAIKNILNMGGSPGDVSESLDVGEAKEGLQNEL